MRRDDIEGPMRCDDTHRTRSSDEIDDDVASAGIKQDQMSPSSLVSAIRIMQEISTIESLLVVTSSFLEVDQFPGSPDFNELSLYHLRKQSMQLSQKLQGKQTGYNNCSPNSAPHRPLYDQYSSMRTTCQRSHSP